MDPIAPIVIALFVIGGLAWIASKLLDITALLDRIRGPASPRFSVNLEPLKGLETQFQATITLASGGPVQAPHFFATVDGSEVSVSLGQGMMSDGDSETVTSIAQRRVLTEVYWVLYWRDLDGVIHALAESGDNKTWRPRLRLGPRARSKADQVEDELRQGLGVERIHPKRRLERLWRWFERDPITGHWPVLYHREKVELESVDVFKAFYKTVKITGTARANLKADRRAHSAKA